MKTSFTLKSSRLEALTDGVFAIAMTILVFNLTQSNDPIYLNLSMSNHLYYKLFVYVGSFIILGTYWVGMVFQYGFLQEVNRAYLWINIIFLMLVGIIPFSAFLFAEIHQTVYSVNFYSINLLAVAVTQLISWAYAQHYNLNSPVAKGAISRSIYRRISISLICYVLALLLSQWGDNIAFIFLLIPPSIHIFPGKLDKYLT